MKKSSTSAGADGLVGGGQVLDVADEHAGADAEHPLEEAVGHRSDGEQHPQVRSPRLRFSTPQGQRPDCVGEHRDEDRHPQVYRLPPAQLLADHRVDEVVAPVGWRKRSAAQAAGTPSTRATFRRSQRTGTATGSVDGWASSIVVMGAPCRRALTAR